MFFLDFDSWLLSGNFGSAMTESFYRSSRILVPFYNTCNRKLSIGEELFDLIASGEAKNMKTHCAAFTANSIFVEIEVF